MDSTALIVATASLFATTALADDAARLENWYRDPFFAVSSQIAGCPEPRGPLMTRIEMEREAHVRVERGTRCYLEGRCTKSNSYLYDPDIATKVSRALEHSPAIKGTSLWISVQRRWVTVEGCAKSKSKKSALEAIIRRIPDVDHVFVELWMDPKQPAPYKVLGH